MNAEKYFLYLDNVNELLEFKQLLAINLSSIIQTVNKKWITEGNNKMHSKLLLHALDVGKTYYTKI